VDNPKDVVQQPDGDQEKEVVGGRRGDVGNPKDVVQQPDGDQQKEVVGGRREDRDNPEEATQQPDGDQKVDVLGLLDVLRLVGPALLGEIEEKLALVEGVTEPTGGIAPEKTLGRTTGDGGAGRLYLG
jgi:hypothetical protein